MVTLNTVENTLKSVYLEYITDLLNKQTNPLLAKIKQTTSDVWGKEVRIPIENSEKYGQFVTTLKNLYGQIEISDKAIKAIVNSLGCFTDMLNAEFLSLLEVAKFNLSRQIYGDGSGFLCTIGDREGHDYYCNCRNLIEGMFVDIYEEDYISRTDTILSIDRNTSRIKLGSGTSANIDSDLYVHNAKGRELTGIAALFNDKNIYGLSRKDYPILNPYVKKVADKFNPQVIRQAIDHIQETSNSTIDFMAISADVKYAYQSYLAEHSQNFDVVELEGGYKVISFDGVPMVYDRFIPNGAMYLLSTENFKLHQLCNWRYLENENGSILTQNRIRPVYSATLVKYCDLICNKPCGQGKITWTNI